MDFSESDITVIYACWTAKERGTRKVVEKVLGKRRKVVSVQQLISKIKQTDITKSLDICLLIKCNVKERRINC